MFDNTTHYSKFLIALAGGVVAILTYLYSDATWLPILVNLLSAIGVYTVPNAPKGVN